MRLLQNLVLIGRNRLRPAGYLRRSREIAFLQGKGLWKGFRQHPSFGGRQSLAAAEVSQEPVMKEMVGFRVYSDLKGYDLQHQIPLRNDFVYNDFVVLREKPCPIAE